MVASASNVLACAPASWLASAGGAQAVVTLGQPPSPWTSAGQAPLTARSASCEVIFDGWLYNRAGLRQFAAEASDAELALEAYLRWGEEALRKLKGIFALVIWDGRSETLICARDPLGTYPLFYAESGNELLVSSSIEALLYHPRVSSALNRAALADYLYDRSPESDETLFASVRRLPPGHALQVRGGRRQVYRYWDPVPEDYRIKWLSDEEVERFAFLLEQAVGRSMEEGPVGICLSGGLDSCTVAAAAAAYSCEKGLPLPWALTLSFAYPEWTEDVVQKGVAQSLGLPRFELPFDVATGPQGMLLTSLEAGRNRAMPLLNPFGPAFYNLAARSKAYGRQVILTGDGGDEWFLDNPWVASDLLYSRNLKQLYRLWHNWRKPSALAAAKALLWHYGLRAMLRRQKVALLYRLASSSERSRVQERIARETPSWLVPEPALRREFIERREERLERHRQEKGGFYQRWVRGVLTDPVNSLDREQAFEEGRRSGLRWRSPFWDAEVVDFLVRTPFHLRNAAGQNKRLLRRFLHPIFPHLGFDRQEKSHHGAFIEPRTLHEARKVWQGMKGLKALAQLGVVDGKLVDAKIAEMLSQERLSEAGPLFLWLTLSTETWVQARLGSARVGAIF